MILFQDMGQFMNNDIIDDAWRRHYEPPGEGKAIIGGT
jgi:hypothetical protein